jgi:hypothetical protein
MLEWADNVGSAMAALIQDYRKTKNQDSLDELNRGVSAMQAVVETLIERHNML